MEHIGGETMVLYADLRERLEAFEAMRTIASLPGEFNIKKIKGKAYYYFQATLASGRVQIYVGPDNENVRALIADHKAGKKHARADEKLIERLGAQIIAGNVSPVPYDMARIINILAHSGVFRAGGVLVGTLAFKILGTHLGVQWESVSRTTQDIDLAGGGMSVALPDVRADIPAAIDSLHMGFFPVPGLSPKEPSTTYAIRGKTLRIDLLTPMRRGRTAPVFIQRFNAAALPLKYLDYLIQDPVNAVLIAGKPCLVRIPQPARFALHKLIISRQRRASAADKKQKDISQASSLIKLLQEEHPGDLPIARDELFARGESWKKMFKAACKEARISV
jgi:hypothetical protein